MSLLTFVKFSVEKLIKFFCKHIFYSMLSAHFTRLIYAGFNHSVRVGLCKITCNRCVLSGSKISSLNTDISQICETF
jgi:hypothetical protein